MTQGAWLKTLNVAMVIPIYIIIDIVIIVPPSLTIDTSIIVTLQLCPRAQYSVCAVGRRGGGTDVRVGQQRAGAVVSKTAILLWRTKINIRLCFPTSLPLPSPRKPTYPYKNDSVFSVEPPVVSPEDMMIYEQSVRVANMGPQRPPTTSLQLYSQYADMAARTT